MKVQVAFDGVKVSDDLQQRVVEVFNSIGKLVKDYESDLLIFYVRVSKRSSWGYKVSVSVQMPGKGVYAEEKGKELMSTLRGARNNLKRQIRKYVERLQEK